MKPKFQITNSLLRYSTVAIVAVVVAFVAIDERVPDAAHGVGKNGERVYTFGWPFVAAHRVSHPFANQPKGMEYWDITWWIVVLNLALLAIILVCVFGIASKSTSIGFPQNK